MESEIKLNGTVLAENDAAGTEEDPIISLIRAKYTDADGKIHLAMLQTLLSCVTDNNGKRLDRIIEELREAVGTGGKPITEIINTEIDKKVGNLSDLPTENKENVVSSLDELKQGIDKKWQFVPKASETTENPETFKTGCVYSVEGELSIENGHPYNAGWDHITYLVYGDSHESGEGYKNIVAISYSGRTFVKAQGWNTWTKWKEFVDMEKLFKWDVDVTNLDEIVEPGVYVVPSSVSIIPPSTMNWGNESYIWAILVVEKTTKYGDWITQTLKIAGSKKGILTLYRMQTNGEGWGEWEQIIDTGNLYGLVSNKNLLINPDFRFNQRGISELTSNNHLQYICDRWYHYASNDHSIVKYINNKIVLYEGRIGQVIEDIKLGTYTITVKILSTDTVALVYKTGDILVGTIPAEAGEYSFTTVLGDEHSFFIQTNAPSTNGIVFDWIKLELGSVATQFVPPSSAEELMKCQRYYKKIDYGLLGYTLVKTYLNIDTNATKSMRIIPTVKFTKDIIQGNDLTIIPLSSQEVPIGMWYPISITINQYGIIILKDTGIDFADRTALWAGFDSDNFLELDAEYY